jgi:hypothetical protein
MFLPVWLAGWTAGEVFTIVELARLLVDPSRAEGSHIFMGVWLVAWTIGGAFVWFALLFNIAGREHVFIDAVRMTVALEMFRFSRKRVWMLSDVSNLRFAPPVYTRNSFSYSMAPWGLGAGSIAFQAAGETHRFGSSLSEEESAEVISELKRRFPIAA